MNIIILGSEGAIGKPLAKYLKEQGHHVFRVDLTPGFGKDYLCGDINNPQEIEEHLSKHNYDVCYCLSAVYGRLANEKAPSMSTRTNLSGLANVIELCRQYQIKLIFTSSSEVYGGLSGKLHEERFDLRPNNLYGLLKLQGEQLLQYHIKYNKLDAVILRANMITSPNEPFGEYRSAMVRFCESLYKEEPIHVHIGAKRSWLHIYDACRVFERAMELDSGTVMNVGHPKQVSIEEVAEYLVELFGVDKSLIYKTVLPEQMTLEKNIVVEKMTKLTGVIPVYSWDDICDEFAYNVKKRLS